MSPSNGPPLIVHVIFTLATGGLENGLVNLINRTPPGRYRHAVVCLTSSSDFASRISAADVPIFELHKKPGQDIGVHFRLWKLLWRLRPAVIHTRNLAALEMQFVGFFVPGAKRVHGEHGRDIQDLDGTRKKYNLLRKAMRPLVHRYITVSDDLRQWLLTVIAVPAAKVRRIYTGVCQETFHPPVDRGALTESDDKQPLVVATVGRLATVKNQLSLVNAMANIFDACPDMRGKLLGVIVGAGPARDELQKRIAELGIAESVQLLGDRQDIPDILRTADIYVLPSLAEGISNTILEAMATGLPVIATKVGGNPELVENGVTGFLVPVSDDGALTDAIVKLLESPQLRTTMGQKGLEKVRRAFSWTRAVDEYLAVYDELLGSDGRSTVRHVQQEGGKR